jgi:hypothetical protein
MFSSGFAEGESDHQMFVTSNRCIAVNGCGNFL